VAISDPTNDVMMRNIREALDGTDVQFAVATRSELTEIITELFNPNGPTSNGNGNGAYSNGASPALESPVAVAEPETSVEPEPAVEPEVAAEPEVTVEPAPEPELVTEPEQVPEPVMTAEPAVESESEPLAEPVALAPEPEPLPEPVALAPEPVAVAPEPVVHTPEPVALTPEPDPEPAPAPLRIAPPQPVEAERQSTEPGVVTFRVVIRLSNSDRVEAAVVGDPMAAKAQAKALIRYIAGKDGTDWPYIGGRFLKPDAIVSVDLVEQSPGETA
jgi:hypothetical protein